jgi:hypothetical protein
LLTMYPTERIRKTLKLFLLLTDINHNNSFILLKYIIIMNKIVIEVIGMLFIAIIFSGFVFGNVFYIDSSIREKHLECINNTCTIVEGEGDNHCLPEGSICGSASQTCVDNDVLGNRKERIFARGGSWGGHGVNASEDVCEGGRLTEYYCGEEGEEFIEYVCPWGCASSDGRCVLNPPGPCFDSDGGSNTLERGCVTKGNATICDFCSVGAPVPSVYEARCLGGGVYIETTCGSNGCHDGACGGGAHLGCVDNDCRYINGPGDDECKDDFDCGPSHTTCYDKTCILSLGEGEDECSTDFECLK